MNACQLFGNVKYRQKYSNRFVNSILIGLTPYQPAVMQGGIRKETFSLDNHNFSIPIFAELP